MEFEVSIIVPVYNVNRYIKESIESICLQKFDSYEVVLVDDGTEDNSIEIAEEVLKKYSISYAVVKKDNGGLPSARNAGIKAAKGKYVCFIDSDDLISCSHINDLWTICNAHQLVAAFSLFQLTYENNRRGNPTIDNVGKVINREQLLADFLVRKLRIHCCTLLVEKQYLIDNNIFFNEKLRYGEDIDFMWRLFPTLTSVGCTENESYLYLQRANSLMSTQNIDRVEVLLGEFGETVNLLRINYPNDEKIWKYLYGKASLAFYRTFAESSDYELFMELLDKTNYKSVIKSNLTIKSTKLRILALSLLISPKLFVFIVKHNRETISTPK